MIDRKKLARKLVVYAKARLGIEGLDLIYLENIILKALGEASPFEGELDYVPEELPDALYEELEEALRESGAANPHHEAVALFGLLTPMPSAVDERFHRLYGEKGAEEATEYLYELGRHNGYYAESALKKNLRWDANYQDGSLPLVITINLSKPEKSNKDIAAALGKSSVDYPACALCKENLGFEGRGKIPPRGTLRFVSMLLDGRSWFLQYSPYGYFGHHCIAFEDAHRPMKIDRGSFAALLDFVDLFPHFFIGSNSDLPIVGGSILTHEHFQGGNKELPLFKAKKRKVLFEKGGVECSILDFYDSVVLLSGKDKDKLVDRAERLLLAWRSHVDPKRSFPGIDEDGTLHQTLTPFASKEGDEYRLYLILRCNSVDEAHPGGIYHAHEERWAIKKEGIGLIEAAGLFVLPARLSRQLKLLSEGAKKRIPFADLTKENPDLQGFSDCYSYLLKGNDVHEYVNSTCREILNDVAVYKGDAASQLEFERFVREALK